MERFNAESNSRLRHVLRRIYKPTTLNGRLVPSTQVECANKDAPIGRLHAGVNRDVGHNLCGRL